MQAVSTSAHSLKSTCAHVGAMKLAAMCASLERQMRQGDASRAAPLVDGLEVEWTAVRCELDLALEALIEP